MLGRKAAFGGALVVGARLITRVIDLVAMLILARILLPNDFGLVAIALSVVSVTEAALELPVNQVLVRLPSITGSQYDTAFTLSLLRAGMLGLLLLLIAWPFAAFYADARLMPLVGFLSLAPVARGLVSPRLAEYQRGLSFWRDFSIEIGGKVTACLVGVVIAVLTHSYWAMAVGTVAYPVAATVGSYVLAPYRPRLSLSDLALFTDFLGGVSLAQIISALNWNFERMLLGKVVSTTQLGIFTASSDVASIPLLAFFGPLMRPLLAAFSHVQDNPARLAQSYLSATEAVAGVGLPLLVGESLLADPTIRLILGEKWLAAVPLVPWLALSLVPALLALPAIPLIMAVGRTRLLVYRNSLEFSIKLPVAVIGSLQFGFFGVMAARFVSELVAGVYCMTVVRRLTGVSVEAQLRASWRTAVGTGVMVPPVLVCSALFGEGGGVAQSALHLLTAGTLGAVVYTMVVYWLWRMSGRPAGFEAVVVSTIGGALARAGLPERLALWRGLRSGQEVVLPENGGPTGG